MYRMFWLYRFNCVYHLYCLYCMYCRYHMHRTYCLYRMPAGIAHFPVGLPVRSPAHTHTCLPAFACTNARTRTPTVRRPPISCPSLRSPACLSVYRLTQVPLIPSLSRSHFPLSHNPISLSPLSLSTQQIHTMCSTLSTMCSTWKSHSHIMCKQKLANGTCPHPARLPARIHAHTNAQSHTHSRTHSVNTQAYTHPPTRPPACPTERTHAGVCERTVGGGDGEHTYARAGTLPYGMHTHA